MIVAKLRPGEKIWIPGGTVMWVEGDKLTWVGDPDIMGDILARKDEHGDFLLMTCPNGCLLVSEEKSWQER